MIAMRGDPICASAYIAGRPSERPYVLNYWASALGDKGGEGAMAQALPLYREAVRLKPDYWIGYYNIMFALDGLGDEEGVMRVGEQMKAAAGGRPGRSPEENYQNYDQKVWDLPRVAPSRSPTWIPTAALGRAAATGAENLNVAQFEAMMHDVEAAALRIKTSPVEEKNAPDVAAAAFDRALLAEELGDLNAAARRGMFCGGVRQPYRLDRQPCHICYAAVTYEKTGQPAKADAALNPAGKSFVDCYRFKGDVLDLRGDWSGAQWYAKAAKLGPSVPSGYYSWGIALSSTANSTAQRRSLRMQTR